MKEKETIRAGQGTKDGNSKTGKGAAQKSEPKKKTETRKASK